MKNSTNWKVVFISVMFILSSIAAIQLKASSGLLAYEDLIIQALSGKELLRRSGITSCEPSGTEIIAAANESASLFWDLGDGDVIDYNPVVLSVNHNYWDYLDFYDENEDYIFEMYANNEPIFDASYAYANYDDYWYYAYDWNISSISPGTAVNLSVFFYQESNPNLNHTASIDVTINYASDPPPIDLDSFKIHLFHFAGDLYTAGGAHYWTPEGANPDYHFTIYSDGLVELKFGQQSLMDSKDYSSEKSRSLMQVLQNLRVFDLKEFYFAPSYDYYYDSWYHIYIESRHIQEWRGAEESFAYYVNPGQYASILEAIFAEMETLYFKPKRLGWQIALYVVGGSVGGIACCAFGVYLLAAFRRR